MPRSIDENVAKIILKLQFGFNPDNIKKDKDEET